MAPAVCVLLHGDCYAIARTVLESCTTSMSPRIDYPQNLDAVDVDSAFAILGQSLSLPSKGDLGSALSAAAYHSHADLVQLLIDLGADVNTCRSAYGSPLTAAAVQSELKVVELLLSHGTTVDMQHLRDIVVWRCDPDSLKLLFGQHRGPDPDELEQLMLHSAAAFQSSTIPLLVSRGADIAKRDEDRNTALHHAAGTASISSTIQPTVGALIDLGADVNAVGGEYGTALVAASAVGNAEAVEMLLKCEADTHYRSENYGTTIEAACKGERDAARSGPSEIMRFDQGFAEAIRLLSEAGLHDNPSGFGQEKATVPDDQSQNSRKSD